jgi:iron complex transport system substrate-binding protein
VRPTRVRKEKPRVSAFASADIPKIIALEPDLVFTFSDLQAEIVASFIREGIAVHAFNQRTVGAFSTWFAWLAQSSGSPKKNTAWPKRCYADWRRYDRKHKSFQGGRAFISRNGTIR